MSVHFFFGRATSQTREVEDISGGFCATRMRLSPLTSIWTRIAEVRRSWQFNRDRRPETYGELMLL